MDAEIIAQRNGTSSSRCRAVPKGLFRVALLLVQREDDRMRNPHIVRDTDKRRVEQFSARAQLPPRSLQRSVTAVHQ